jgi:hypothetical protein
MATVNEGDLQYGPTPEDAQHEHTDIEPAIAWRFALWLGVAMVLSAALVYGTFWWFEGQELTTNAASRSFPLAAGRGDLEAPMPRLQTQPFKDIYALRENEQRQLTSYEWVDKSTGIVRIPVEDAMRIMAERGMVPAQQGLTPNGSPPVVMDSSAGRMSAGR